MTAVAIASATRAAARPRAGRMAGLAVVWVFVLGNTAGIVWLWAHGGNLTTRSTGDVLTSVARITGLLSAYMALIQVVLLARLPVLERLVGFDRLTVWHRWNGHATIDLVVAHVFFSVWGYAAADRFSIGKEISTMLGGGIYPGMITATVGTGLLLGVVATSYVIVRRRLRYEWWYAVHLLAYAGIALAWFHQIPTGNELVLDTVAADYWRALYIGTLALLVGFRVVPPLVNVFRYRLRVADVVEEGPGVVSIRMTGRRLDRLHARPGQFFQWRFLNRWWTAHPFSLSEAPDGRSLRITVKALGDHSGDLAGVPVGTRVVAEGPFGVFTDAHRRTGKRLLLAGGIGITPVRALAEHPGDDDVVVY
ncbi:MAG: ferredoxin reductase family protein, partial [Gaiellaceae bacterium]